MSDTNEKKSAPHEEGPDTGHDYDGIRELDNRLPNWWLGTLFASIIFAAGYWVHYEIFEGTPNLTDEYLAEMEIASEQALAAAKARGGLDDTALAALVEQKPLVEQGHQAYGQFCASCHGDKGQGLVGPNLTDKYWLHGAKPTEILKTVASGVTAKGMPAWEPVLGPSKVEAVVAFLLTVKDTNVAGKEPQGEPVGGEAAPAPGGAAPANGAPADAIPANPAPTQGAELGAPAGVPAKTAAE